MKSEIEKQEEKIKAINENVLLLMKGKRYAQMMAEKQRAEQERQKLLWMLEHEKKKFGQIFEGISDEERRKWSKDCLMLIILADMLDTVATDMNGRLERFSGMTLEVYRYVQRVKENTNALVHKFDIAGNAEVSQDWGDLSDIVRLQVENNVNAHLSKMKSNGN